jgi:hypothetical protein
MKYLPIFAIMFIVIASACAQRAAETSQGNLQLKITDAVENISSLNITISQILVHKAETDVIEKIVNETTNGTETNETNITGWITVLSSPVTVDLVTVENVTDILAENILENGKYTQIRFLISDAKAEINGTVVNVTIPSSGIKLIHPFVIEENKTTSLVLDFNADESLIKTGSSNYILKPVVGLLTEFKGKNKTEADAIKSQQLLQANTKKEQIRSQRQNASIYHSQIREFTVLIEDAGYTPSQIVVNKNDTVKLTVITQAGTVDHKHSITIDSYKINQRIIATDIYNPQIIQFVANQSGTFTIYCGMCINGTLGKGHPNITMSLIVNDIQ